MQLERAPEPLRLLEVASFPRIIGRNHCWIHYALTVLYAPRDYSLRVRHMPATKLRPTLQFSSPCHPYPFVFNSGTLTKRTRPLQLSSDMANRNNQNVHPGSPRSSSTPFPPSRLEETHTCRSSARFPAVSVDEAEPILMSAVEVELLLVHSVATTSLHVR